MMLWRRPGFEYDLRQDPKNPLYNFFVHFELRDNEGRFRPWEDPLPPEVLHPPDAKMAEAVLTRVIDLIYGGQQGYAWAPPVGQVREVATALFTGVLMDLDRTRTGRRCDIRTKGARNKPLFGAAQRRYDLFQQLQSRLIESPQKLPTVAELAEQAATAERTSRGRSSTPRSVRRRSS
jgi:hypothetical protein